MYDVDAMGRGPCQRAYPAKAKPSVTSLVPPPPASITNRINTLELELAARNRELGTMRANYDRALVEATHAANEVDEMWAELNTFHRDLAATQANLGLMNALFEEYKQ